MNRLKSIVLDYEAKEFKVTIAFAEGAFKPMINWMGQELHVDLTTFVYIYLLLKREKNKMFGVLF